MARTPAQTSDDNGSFNLGGAPAQATVNAAQDAGGDVFDLTGVEENKSFELLPKGKYGAIVDELTFGDSSSGNPMITAVFQITDAEFAGRKMYDYWVLGGDGAEFGKAKLKKFLLRVCPETDISAFHPAKFCDSGDAIGRGCTLEVAITTQKKGDYKGQKRNQVRDILPMEGMFMSGN